MPAENDEVEVSNPVDLWKTLPFSPSEVREEEEDEEDEGISLTGLEKAINGGFYLLDSLLSPVSFLRDLSLKMGFNLLRNLRRERRKRN